MSKEELKSFKIKKMSMIFKNTERQKDHKALQLICELGIFFQFQRHVC